MWRPTRAPSQHPRRGARLVRLGVVVAVLLAAAPAAARPPAFSSTERVSLGTGNVQGVRSSGEDVAASARCRFVAFSSRAPNWVAGDTAGHKDVFIRDRAS